MTSVLRRAPRTTPLWICRRCCSTTTAHVTKNGASPARTRFAPSPTGFLHLGSLRTALFNYLYAKATGGQFLLRIEDTDKKRTVEGAEEGILETLKWAGIEWDEGPLVGGEYGPYRQSERTELHRDHAHKLLKEGHAYRCFCTPERLQVLALTRKRSGMATEYDRHCASISHSESEERASKGEKHVIRLKVPDVYPAFDDLVYGTINVGENTRAHSQGSYEDPILLKSDGMPTYHLANVVDDHHMKITHVIRATEWLPSTPKHVHLYNCFKWTPPKFVHVGLLQDANKAKLSKRNGDVFVSEYREKGYLPEALNNFVALLGWSHEGRSDVLTMKDLIKNFEISRLTAGNTVVNFEKLSFLQKQHVEVKFDNGGEGAKEVFNAVTKEVYKVFGDILETGEPITEDYIGRVLHYNVRNYTIPSDFVSASSYFFKEPDFSVMSKPVIKSKNQLSKFLSQNAVKIYDIMKPLVEPLNKLSEAEWTVEKLKELTDSKEDGLWQYRMKAVRLGLAAGNSGPSVAETMFVLGKERSMKRLGKLEEINI
ncbi:Glutamate--tRNA ligase mitochondrial [Rhizina undulata]